MVFGSKLGWHYKPPRAPAGAGHCTWAAWEWQLRREVQEMLPTLLCPPAPSRSLAPCPQEPGSTSPGSSAVPLQEAKSPRGLSEPSQGLGAHHNLPMRAISARRARLFRKRPLAFPQKSQTAACWGAATCPQHPSLPAQVTSCCQAGEQPEVAAQATRLGWAGEATFPGWVRGNG